MRSTSCCSFAASGRHGFIRANSTAGTRIAMDEAMGKSYTPVESARMAGLHYVSECGPGISRRASGKAFRYLLPSGARVRDHATLRRIRALAIPPAWTDVWICPRADGHIQATGRDARGRKQYRYHARWREMRDETKFDRMVAFGHALPGLRARIEADLRRPGLPREKVLAAVVRLL